MRNATALLIVGAVLVLIALTGCGVPLHPYESLNRSDPDVFPPVEIRTPLCDFGILRGTKHQWCSDEFKRKEWLVWT
jgi:hypothetical protein